MASRMGQAKRSSGRSRLNRPMPLENQMTISLSVYRRESVMTMATNRPMVMMLGRKDSSV